MRDYNFAANYAAPKDLSSSNYYTGSVQKAYTPEISKYDRLINKLKDNNKVKKFKYAHGASVVINFIQMIGLIYLLI